MQAGRRGGHRSVVAREHRLVVGAVLRIGDAAPDIGWQRHRTGLFEMVGEEGADLVEGQHDRSVGILGFDGGLQVREVEVVAKPQPLGRPGKGKPMASAQVADQQRFNRYVLPSAGAGTHALETRWNDPCVVGDQQVAPSQQRGQVAHDAIVQPVRRDVEQARGIARLHRSLRDEVVREIEVEEVDAHGVRMILVFSAQCTSQRAKPSRHPSRRCPNRRRAIRRGDRPGRRSGARRRR